MPRVFHADRIALDSKSRVEFTPDGFAVIHDAVISREGIYRYANADGTERLEYRPPETVFSTDALRSVAGKPFTNDHPPEFVSPDNARRYQVGTVGDRAYRDILRGVGVVRVSRITVHDAQAISDLRAGKREVSPGYWAEYDPTPGVTPEGERFDGTQKSITINHVALCDAGRGGIVTRLPRVDSAGAKVNWAVEVRTDGADMPPRRYLDAFVEPSGGQFEVRMGDPPFDVLATFSSEEEAQAEVDRLHSANDPRPAARGAEARRRWVAWKEAQEAGDADRTDAGKSMKTLVIDGEGVQLPSAAVPAIRTLQSRLDAERDRADRAEGQVAALKTELDELKSRPTIDADALKARRALERQAEPHLSAADVARLDDLTDREIRELVVQARFDGLDLTDRTDAYLDGLFDAAVQAGGESGASTRSADRSHRADAEPALPTDATSGVERVDFETYRAARTKQRRDVRNGVAK